jgi:hypothetical protein
MSEKYSLGPAKLVQETDKALRVRLEDYDDAEHWVPKSVVHDDSEVWDEHNDEGELVVSKWWAEKQSWS